MKTVIEDEETRVLTLEPNNEHESHDPVFINELKLVDFKQALAKSSVFSEFSGGVLWCCNGTVAVRKVITNKSLLMSKSQAHLVYFEV